MASSEPITCDVVVVGGGSGGLAFAKEAADLGASVVILDFVKPSTQGTTWGLGGTCVNVGCIPKKLMHQASLIGQSIKYDAEAYGWNTEKTTHDWGTMVQNIQNHIRSLNWGYKVQLQQKNIKYLNAYGVLVDPHTVECTDKSGNKSLVKAQHILLATGGRPKYPDFPGSTEYCISSDDIFHMKKHPGKCLVIGGSYVALECAGFLHGVGCDVTVMVRSIFLRGFDQQMANLIGSHMESLGIKFLRPLVPSKVERSGDKLKAFWVQDGQEKYEEFDTILCAVGRSPLDVGAAKIGVAVDKNSGKILTENDRTSIPNIYAIGDLQFGAPELTPTAIRAGVLLARRLFAGSEEQMDYINVPTTVFTPLEYGSCGMSEEKATETFGEDAIDVYHSAFKPLEWTVPEIETESYCKLIVHIPDNNRVVGLHILAPNAGEITQGFGVAMRMGATKKHFDSTVGIHPTIAEELTLLSVTKRSGSKVSKSGC